jgi:hypothetical protein
MDTLIDVPSIENANYALEHGKCIGIGSFRQVYHLTGSKWVYKFERGNEGTNHEEYCNSIRYANQLPENVFIPEMVMLSNGVIAAELITGILVSSLHYGWDDDCSCKEYNLAVCYQQYIEPMTSKVFDLSGSNVILTREGKVYLIDLGEYGSNSYFAPYEKRQRQLRQQEGQYCICGCGKEYKR